MTPRRLSDAALLASIAEATAAWSAPQDTEYYAQKHSYDHRAMHVRLVALETAGQVQRERRHIYGGRTADYWEVTT